MVATSCQPWGQPGPNHHHQLLLKSLYMFHGAHIVWGSLRLKVSLLFNLRIHYYNTKAVSYKHHFTQFSKQFALFSCPASSTAPGRHGPATCCTTGATTITYTTGGASTILSRLHGTKEQVPQEMEAKLVCCRTRYCCGTSF